MGTRLDELEFVTRFIKFGHSLGRLGTRFGLFDTWLGDMVPGLAKF